MVETIFWRLTLSLILLIARFFSTRLTLNTLIFWITIFTIVLEASEYKKIERAIIGQKFLGNFWDRFTENLIHGKIRSIWSFFLKSDSELHRFTGKLIQSSIGEFWGVTQAVIMENSSSPNVTYHMCYIWTGWVIYHIIWFIFGIWIIYGFGRKIRMDEFSSKWPVWWPGKWKF